MSDGYLTQEQCQSKENEGNVWQFDKEVNHYELMYA